jgi:integrating conjugative element protein (TIGR03752 family)
MHSNGLLKWLMIPLALLLLFVGVRLFSGSSDAPMAPKEAVRLTPDEAKALGIEGDTPRDTVATLVAQVRQLRTELQTALSDNKTQREENQRLRQREGAIDRRIQSALENERSQLHQDREQVASERQQTQGLLQQLQQRLDSIGKDDPADLPVGLGLEPGDGLGGDALRWVEPDDRRDDGKQRNSGNAGSFSFPTRFGPAQKTLETKATSATSAVDAGRRAAAVPETTAVYTVPSNATLMGSIAMTALIGRVPIDSTVNDPYPFKVLIGRDNLTANGIDIPDVAGAVVSGTASGDWTLSCVRGQIRSVTFVFEDGTIRTIPEDGQRGANRQQNNSGNNTQDGLGWISDPHGIPCVSGQRRSNAQQYLGTQALTTAAGAGVASLIDSDSGQVW